MTNPTPHETDLRSLIGNIVTEARALIHTEVQLPRRELSENAARAGGGLALLFFAALVAFVGLSALAVAAVLGVAAMGVAIHWAALIVAIAFLVIASFIALIGKSRISAASLAPKRTLKQVKSDIDAVKRWPVLNAEQLERNAETHRAHLTDQLSALASSVNPEASAKRVVGHTADLGQTVAKAVFENARQAPAGLALVGIGAALIALSTGKKSEEPHLTSYDEMEGHDDRIARADALMKSRQNARSGQFASTPSASSLRKALDAGLDKLSPQARARVIDARLKVIDAQEKLERQARRTSKQARDAHDSQPFLTGAIVAGIGAVIGALLPSTKAEVDLIGAARDKMMRDAEAVLRDEIANLERQGKAAVESGLREARREFEASQQSA